MSQKSTLVIPEREESIWLLFWTFLKIGSTAFGGFMALISVVQNYMVERRRLISQDDMLDGISLATILPGPIAVNVVAYAGYRIRGLLGAIICATAVILPSFILLIALSYVYFTWGELPAISSLFNGFLPAVAAIIVVAVINMARNTLSGGVEALIAFGAMFAIIFIGGFYSTILVIFVSGVLGYLFLPHGGNRQNIANNDNGNASGLMALIVAYASVLVAAVAKSNAVIAAKLFSSFSIMSLLLFGGGFVFIPLMQEVIVDEFNWLSHKEFIDGIALGQVTPGPILISATFIGYKVAGLVGAVVATIGIFAPPAIVMLICTGFLDRIKNSDVLKAVIRGIRCGVIGMIAAAAWVVISTASPNLVTLIIFILSMSALLVLKLEIVWIIPMAGIVGYLMY